jgi:hypothetical protein
LQVETQLGRLVTLLDLKKTSPKVSTPAAEPQKQKDTAALLADGQPITSASNKHASDSGDAGAQKRKKQRTVNADV